MAKRISDYKLSKNQLLLLKVVVEGTGSSLDPWLNLDQIIEKLAKLGWKPESKRTITQAVDALIERTMIEKRGLLMTMTEKGKKAKVIIAGTQRGREEYEAAIATGRLLIALREFEAKM